MNIVSLLGSAAGENFSLGEAALDVFIGMAIVFAVLVILIAVIYLMRMVFVLFGKKSNAEDEKPVQVKAEEVQAVQPTQTVVVNNEEEIAAVIGAVMAIYYSDSVISGKQAPFRVKNIYKIR